MDQCEIISIFFIIFQIIVVIRIIYFNRFGGDFYYPPNSVVENKGKNFFGSTAVHGKILLVTPFSKNL